MEIRILPSDRHAPSLIPPQGAQTETETKRQKTKIGTHLWKVRHGCSAQKVVLRVLWIRGRRVENKSHCGRLRMLCWGFGAVADHGQTYTAHRRLLAAKHYCTHQDARSAYPYLPDPDLYKVFLFSRLRSRSKCTARTSYSQRACRRGDQRLRIEDASRILERTVQSQR